MSRFPEDIAAKMSKFRFLLTLGALLAVASAGSVFAFAASSPVGKADEVFNSHEAHHGDVASQEDEVSRVGNEVLAQGNTGISRPGGRREKGVVGLLLVLSFAFAAVGYMIMKCYGGRSSRTGKAPATRRLAADKGDSGDSLDDLLCEVSLLDPHKGLVASAEPDLFTWMPNVAHPWLAADVYSTGTNAPKQKDCFSGPIFCMWERGRLSVKLASCSVAVGHIKDPALVHSRNPKLRVKIRM